MLGKTELSNSIGKTSGQAAWEWHAAIEVPYEKSRKSTGAPFPPHPVGKDAAPTNPAGSILGR